MSEYQVIVKERWGDEWRSIGYLRGSGYEVMKWMQEQIRWLKKEPHMEQRFEGEEPLEGLE